MNNLYCYYFWRNFVFFVYKKYFVISNYTFFGWIHFSDKMMLKKLHTKENQKTYILDGTNQHRIKKHLSIYIYIVYTWICLSFFGSKKGSLRGKKDTSFWDNPPHTLAQKSHCEFCCGMHLTCTKQSLKKLPGKNDWSSVNFSAKYAFYVLALRKVLM